MQNIKVNKQLLGNGLTVIVVPRNIIPKVSIQLWYNVGSKDEKSGQRGIAHLIEHMIFKGTHILSECDINQITHKLSGTCNAFTSYDYTGYLFNFPSQHWHEALPIMSDCMRNCLFNQEFLNSELKAVIQELKMYKDDYVSSLVEAMVSTIFYDHPYHHPIIGYKQDLWSLERQNLVDFYQHHYIPNNATLIIVGDVNVEEAFNLAHKNFGNIAPNNNYIKEQFYHSPDLRNYNTTLYRDVKNQSNILTWIIPGAIKNQDYLTDIVTTVLGNGKGSRLYKLLVDELELVTEFEMFSYDLFDYGLLFIYFQPKSKTNVDKIIELINKEIENLKTTLTKNEITRAVKKTEVAHLALLESNQQQAYAIGKNFLAIGDENALYKYLDYPKDNLISEVVDFTNQYLKPPLMHSGQVLPMEEAYKNYWLSLQEISDAEDAKILEGKTREAAIEEGKCVWSIDVKPPKKFEFPTSKVEYLKNGLKLLSYNNSQLPKIDLILDFKAKYYYDPIDKQGLGAFVYSLLLEGTKNYSATSFADILESYGMVLNTNVGQINMSLLASDLPKGLELLNEILCYAVFDDAAIERVRAQILSDIDNYWDTPAQFITQLARDVVYKNHPYSKNIIGTKESIQSITRKDIVNYYKKFVTPQGAILSIVGQLDSFDLKDVFEHMLHSWTGTGSQVEDIDFPQILPINAQEINYPIVRDQIVLSYTGLSVDRLNPDYDKLLLFDQIFTGGLLGSMSSRLFDLRERSGLFYTIGGSLIDQVDKRSGLITVKTIVSNNRLIEAQQAIENVINTAVDVISDQEFEEAQRAISNSLVDNFSSNFKIALTQLFKDKFNLPADYFDNRAAQLNKITVSEMQQSVRKYLNTDKLIKIRVGRV